MNVPPGFPPKCYKTHTEREGGGRRAPMQTHYVCVIKRTPALAGRERGGGMEAREGGVHCHKLNAGLPV